MDIYKVEYESSALLFLIVVAIRFFCIRKYPSKLNKLFGIILICAILDLFLDILGSYYIANPSYVPLWVNYTLNTFFYILQITLSLLVLIYALNMCGLPNRKTNFIYYIPALSCFLILLINPFKHLIFHFEKTSIGLIFTHDILFYLLYTVSALYMLTTVGFILFYRKRLKKIEVLTIISFVFIIVSSIIIQVFLENVLLTGVALSISILMMFFTIQNPESMIDSISKVYNYGTLHEYLKYQISEKSKMWLVAIDVGGIRRTNANYGLRAGNEILRQVGDFLNKNFSNNSIVFQMIGTKFLIIAKSKEQSVKISNIVFERFKVAWKYEEVEIMLIATIRYSQNEVNFSAPEDIINLIDLGYSKTSSMDFGTMRPFSDSLLQQSKRKVEIENALRKAIDNTANFHLSFQPIYSIKAKKFLSAEALLRLEDPEIGSISPVEFIPIAESIGLIHKIDLIVLELCCDFLKKHAEIKISSLKMLEVNLSAAEFYNDCEGFASLVSEKIKSFENMICFEVTETAASTHREILQRFMDIFIAKGVVFAIDDFGTGFSNTMQLTKLPFSIVKIDKSFVTSSSQKEIYILQDLVALFKKLGLTTIIEGVEDKAQAQFAEKINIDEIQGYFYSLPLNEKEFVELLTKNC